MRVLIVREEIKPNDTSRRFSFHVFEASWKRPNSLHTVEVAVLMVPHCYITIVTGGTRKWYSKQTFLAWMDEWMDGWGRLAELAFFADLMRPGFEFIFAFWKRLLLYDQKRNTPFQPPTPPGRGWSLSLGSRGRGDEEEKDCVVCCWSILIVL